MRDRTFVGLCLLLWICIHTHAFSQPDIIFFDRFDESNGLPNNLYKEILQDQQGLLWMAGADGLARYDGYSFTEFRHNHSDSFSISGNNISAMYEDSKGRLWIGIWGTGLNISDDNKSKFYRVRLDPKISKDVSFIVNRITEDKAGNFWIACNNGLIILREEKNGTFITAGDHALWGSPNAELLEDLSFVYTAGNGQIWIGTSSGLCMYDPHQDHFFGPDDFNGLPNRAIQFIAEDRNGNLWVACENDSARFFYTSGEALKFYAFDKIPVASGNKPIWFNFDLDNRLWTTVFGEAAYAFDFKDSTLFLHSKLNTNLTLERFLRGPFIDHSGNVWISGEGFFIYRYPKGFNHYYHPYAFHQSSTFIYGIDHALWLAYRERGIVRLDLTSGKTDHFSAEAEDDFHIPVNHIQKILLLKNGNKILVGHGNISVMNAKDKVIRQHSLSGTNRAVFQDSKDRIWIGSYYGLHLFSEDKGVIKTYTLPIENNDRANFIHAIVEDNNGNIWFASGIKGLGKLNPSTGEIIHFLPKKEELNTLPSVTIEDMAIDRHQIIWLGTDVALVRFDPVTNEFKSYDRNAGLESDYICAVICDNTNRIWVSTHKGISVFDPKKEEFVNYGVRDGLSNTGYYRRNKFYSPSGLIYFGGKNGVDYFDPDAIRKNPTAPLMYLSGITIDRECRLTKKEIEEAGGVKLVPANNIMEIEFIGLHYAAQNEIRYQYQLEGLFDEWTDLGKEHKILLTHMKPGEYTFRAKAITPDNVVSKNEIVIPIRVVPPFYSTLWFRIISTGAFLGLLIGYFKFRETSIKVKDKREAELTRKMNELEKRALQAQMNPHFIYNSMNAIQQFIIVHDVEGAMNYLSRFSRILRAVLNMSAESRIPLYEELKLIEDYIELENMRFPDKFDYSINVSPELNIHAIEIPPFFIQPQVENAIRHGLLRKTTPGHLSVEIKKSGSSMHIIVEDNGIGRKAAAIAKSKETILEESRGMAIVEERLKHLQPADEFQPVKVTDLYGPSGEAAGTRVEIILPLEE